MLLAEHFRNSVETKWLLRLSETDEPTILLMNSLKVLFLGLLKKKRTFKKNYKHKPTSRRE